MKSKLPITNNRSCNPDYVGHHGQWIQIDIHHFTTPCCWLNFQAVPHARMPLAMDEGHVKTTRLYICICMLHYSHVCYTTAKHGAAGSDQLEESPSTMSRSITIAGEKAHTKVNAEQHSVYKYE